METVLKSKTLETVLPDTDPDYPGCLLVAEAQLVQYEGNSEPHFSLTGEIWHNRAARTKYERYGHGDIIAGGRLTEIILRAFPELEPVARVHLATPEGMPMHAEANGWYWYSDYDGRGGTNPPSEWESLSGPERAQAYLNAPEPPPADLDREEFAKWVAGLSEAWKTQADEALAVFEN